MTVLVSEVVSALECVAPLPLAEPWDNCGLLVGKGGDRVHKVLVALDPSPTACRRAVISGAQLLITHHPLFLRPLNAINDATQTGRSIIDLLRAGVSLYCAHTNLDKAAGGVNDHLAFSLGLGRVAPFGAGEKQFKLALTVPEEGLTALLEALSTAGAGLIGDYAGCSFEVAGTGRYTPLEGADPYYGRVGEAESVNERRVECVVRDSTLGRVEAAVREAHPYEEVALDVYPLENPSTTGRLGRIGELVEPMELVRFSGWVAGALGGKGCQMAGDPAKVVKKAAIIGGSGADYWREAQKAGADALVTGDLKYHTAMEATQAGFAIVDCGHGVTEKSAVSAITGLIEGWVEQSGADLTIETFSEPQPMSWVAAEI